MFTLGRSVFKNLTTMSDLAKFSNGNLHYYPEYDYYVTGLRFTNELYTSLTRSCAWEAVFRIRTSAGFNQIQSLGNRIIKQKTLDLVLCPSIDKDRVITYELERASEVSLDENKRQLVGEQRHLFIQSALLYSTAEGERRIRVHNAAIPLTNIPTLPFEYLDTSAAALFYARSALQRLTVNEGNFMSIQSQLDQNLRAIIAAHAKAKSLQSGSRGHQGAQQELSETLQYLQLYMRGMLRTPILAPILQTPPKS